MLFIYDASKHFLSLSIIFTVYVRFLGAFFNLKGGSNIFFNTWMFLWVVLNYQCWCIFWTNECLLISWADIVVNFSISHAIKILPRTKFHALIRNHITANFLFINQWGTETSETHVCSFLHFLLVKSLWPKCLNLFLNQIG